MPFSSISTTMMPEVTIGVAELDDDVEVALVLVCVVELLLLKRLLIRQP